MGAGIDPGFTVGDWVVFKAFPSYQYEVILIEDNGQTAVCSEQGEDFTFCLPSLALRKRTEEDEDL